MKSTVFVAIISFHCFFSCTSDWKWENMDITPIFHDHNSKVWLIDQLHEGGKKRYPLRKIEKISIVFYSNGRYAMYPVTNMGEEPLEKGRYEVISESKQLKMFTEIGVERNYELELKKNRVILKNSPGGSTKQGMELIPFPEF